MARTVAEVEADIAKLEAEKRDILKDQIKADKRKAREALMALHEVGALSKALKEALTDKRGQFAVAKFFPERD